MTRMTRHPRVMPTGTAHTGDASQWAWADHAACRGEDLALFFGAEGERSDQRLAREAKAKQICGVCPVIAECAEYALTRPEKYGMWGSLDEEERVRTRRRWMRHGQLARPAPARPRKPKDAPRPSDVVPAAGSMRRVRALAHLGHGAQHIATVARLRPGTVQRLRRPSEAPRTISRRAADAIARVYPQLLDTPPQTNDDRPRRLAAQHGWAPPAAWDGVDIDDPDTAPRESLEVA